MRSLDEFRVALENINFWTQGALISLRYWRDRKLAEFALENALRITDELMERASSDPTATAESESQPDSPTGSSLARHS